MVILGRP
jgi:hypothetical protein